MAYLQADDERKKRKGEKTVAVENWLAGEGGAQFPPPVTLLVLRPPMLRRHLPFRLFPKHFIPAGFWSFFTLIPSGSDLS